MRNPYATDGDIGPATSQPDETGGPPSQMSSPGIAIALKIIGGIGVLAGTLVTVEELLDSGRGSYSWPLASALSGALLYGFGRAIDFLAAIERNTRKAV